MAEAQPKKILIVENEAVIRRVINRYLVKAGYSVSEAVSGTEALEKLQEDLPDLIVLDVMLPGLDGFNLTRLIRNPVEGTFLDGAREVPIVLITARSDVQDRVIGLELGADDYIVKPFSPNEIVMRVRANLRRANKAQVKTTTQTRRKYPPITVGDLSIDPEQHVVTINDQQIELTQREFKMLYFLSYNAKQVFSRSELLNKIWGNNYYGDASAVTVHIHRLREKIEPTPSDPVYIHTVWGVGYKFEYLPVKVETSQNR